MISKIEHLPLTIVDETQMSVAVAGTHAAQYSLVVPSLSTTPHIEHSTLARQSQFEVAATEHVFSIAVHVPFRTVTQPTGEAAHDHC
jgi:hypothetical protein